jgi:hypothetical protein
VPSRLRAALPRRVLVAALVVGSLTLAGVAFGSVDRLIKYRVSAPVTVQALGVDNEQPKVGEVITGGAKLVAERRQWLDEIVLAVRDQAGKRFDFPSVAGYTIGTRQQEFTARRSFDNPGVYTYWVAYRQNGKWTNLSPRATITVLGENGVPPTPSPTPAEPSPSPTKPPAPTPSQSETSTAPPPPPSKGDFPNPGNTGVPAGTTFRTTVGTTTVTTDGQVIDGWHITGSLIVKADNVRVTNTQVDDSVLNSGGSFTITDSTVGPANCGTPTWMPMAIGSENYTAVRVEIRGHEDGFRASGAGVVIRDSYYKACAPTGDKHADGIQDYPAATGLVVDHNTFDQTGAIGYTAPIFVHSTGTVGARITNNLTKGGVYSVLLQPSGGEWVVTGNRVVQGSYAYGAYEAEGRCGNVATWSDNDVVTVDGSYAVTGTVRDNVSCDRGN